MIKYLPHKKINKLKWDNALDNSFNKTPFAKSWYLDIVCPNWDALVLDDYIEIMPLPKRKKLGISYLFQPILSTRLGVFSTIKEDVFHIDHYLDIIPKKFVLVNISLNNSNSIKSDKYLKYVEQRLHQQIPIGVFDNNYSKSHKKNIQRFSKNSSYSTNYKSSISEFLKLKTAHLKKLKIKNKDINIYKNLIETLSSKNNTETMIIKDVNQEVIGGLCVFFLDYNIISFQSYLNPEKRKSGAIFYLIDEIIKEYSTTYTIDFMGSNIQGIRKRNLGFNSIEKSYNIIKINRILTSFN